MAENELVKMTIKDIEDAAIALVGHDEFYEVANALKEDIMFFNAYIGRNQAWIPFKFKIVPVGRGTISAYEDIYNRYYTGIEYIYEVYAIYLVMQGIILDVYDDESPRKITHANIRKFATWLYSELGLKLEDYVGDFVGCSKGVVYTKAQLFKILHPEENKDAEK